MSVNKSKVDDIATHAHYVSIFDANVNVSFENGFHQNCNKYLFTEIITSINSMHAPAAGVISFRKDASDDSE